MGRIISIHEYDLKPGTNIGQFERILRDAEARGLLQLPGLVAHHFVKGAKGVRRGAYAALEGALAALELGFEQHSLQCIISVTAAVHAAARRVMEKAGLTYRGTRYWMNLQVPVVWYAIDRAAWKASKSQANTL